MVYCEPPNHIPPAVIELADKYYYNCYEKITPSEKLGNYDVYQVLKYDFFRSFILVNNDEIRYATEEEANKIAPICRGYFKNYPCIPIEILGGKIKYYTKF